MLWRLGISFAVVTALLLGFGNAYALGWITWPREWARYLLVTLCAVLAVGALFYREVDMPHDTCDGCGQPILNDDMLTALHDPIKGTIRALGRDDAPPFNGLVVQFHHKCWNARA